MCRGRDSNSHEGLTSRALKARVSTIPPPRQESPLLATRARPTAWLLRKRFNEVT